MIIKNVFYKKTFSGTISEEFRDCKFFDCVFDNCLIDNANFIDCVFEKSLFQNSQFKNSKIFSDFNGCTMKNTKLNNCGIEGSLKKCSFIFVIFYRSSFVQSEISSCEATFLEIDSCIFDYVFINKTNFIKGGFFKTVFKQCKILNNKFLYIGTLDIELSSGTIISDCVFNLKP